MKSLESLFLDHPRSVDESYAEHAVFAGRFAGRLFLASCAAGIHAVFPFLFERTASSMIIDMYGKVSGRGRDPAESATGAAKAETVS